MFKKLLQMFAMTNLLKMGIVDEGGSAEADQKALEQLGAVVEKATQKVAKELEEKYEAKMKEANDKIEAQAKEMSKIKAYANSTEARQKEFNNALDLATVEVFKAVNESATVSENQLEGIKKQIAEKVLAEGDLNPATNSNAGVNVFEKFEKDLIYEIEKFEAIKEFKNINLAKGTKITWTIATNGITATFINEKGLATASEPKFDTVSIDIKKVIALITLTQELEEDQMTAPQLYRLIVEFAGEAIAELLESEILGGNGTNFVGVFNLPGANVFSLPATKTVADITEADMIAIEQKIAFKDRQKATWIMSDYARYILYALRDAGGNRIYPNLLDLNPTIWGRKVIISNYGAEVQDATTNLTLKSFLAFGNLKKYLIAHRTWTTIDKGYYNDGWAREQASIKVRKRAGMGSLDDKAFVVAKNG